MTQLVRQELKFKIVDQLIQGEPPQHIAARNKVSLNAVLSVLNDEVVSAKCLELFRNSARGLSLVALHNIARIAFDKKSSKTTQLRASKILVDIAKEINELHPNDLEPSQMTQKQISSRLQALQKEVMERAKPLDTGVIEAEANVDLANMVE